MRPAIFRLRKKVRLIQPGNKFFAAYVVANLQNSKLTGLGYLFAKTKSDFQTEQAFGASAVATIISATAFLLAGWVERRVRERYA
jgi:ABC-type nitrate/sulfonate/bicarbonate transport system permease component